MSNIYVCPLEHLETTLETSQARCVLSFAGPGKSIKRPTGLNGFVALEFNDIGVPQEGLIAPSKQDVEAIIDTVKNWREEPAIVMQCWMGISRSTAAALIAALVLAPDASPLHMAQTLRHYAPSATPNPLMIEHADDLLACNGSLINAVKNIGRGADANLGSPFCFNPKQLRYPPAQSVTV